VLTAQTFIVSAAATGPVPVTRLMEELGAMLDAYLTPRAEAEPGGDGPAADDGGCAGGRTGLEDTAGI